MRMNLSANKQGFIYFNEVLFGFYKSLQNKQPLFKNGLNNRRAAHLIEEAE
jgi:hypothetical protein